MAKIYLAPNGRILTNRMQLNDAKKRHEEDGSHLNSHLCFFAWKYHPRCLLYCADMRVSSARLKPLMACGQCGALSKAGGRLLYADAANWVIVPSFLSGIV
jgi:hypothetical protein